MLKVSRFLIIFIFWIYSYLLVQAALVPASNLPDLPFQVNDKLIHFLQFLILFIVSRAYFFPFTARFRVDLNAICFAYGLSLAVVTEILQQTVAGRSASYADFFANGIGLILGYSFFWVLKYHKNKQVGA